MRAQYICRVVVVVNIIIIIILLLFCFNFSCSRFGCFRFCLCDGRAEEMRGEEPSSRAHAPEKDAEKITTVVPFIRYRYRDI